MAVMQPSEGYAGSEASSSSQPLNSPNTSGSSSGTTGDKSNNNNNNNNNNNDGSSGDPSKNKVSRKRTKTGCLTCRKRRIKCGEERPTCNNCIKSKRNCEGYNQRVVFKDGMNGLFGRAMGPTDRRFPSGYAPLQPAPGPQALQPLAPAPAAFGDGHFPSLGPTFPPHLQTGLPDTRPTVNLAISLPSPHHRSSAEDFRRTAFQAAGQHDDRYYQTPVSATGSSFSIPQVPRSAASSTEPGSASLFGAPPTPFTSSPPSFSNSLSQSFVPAHPNAASSPNSCPFNPPLDPKYALFSGTSGSLTQPATEFNNMFNRVLGADGASDMATSMGQPDQLDIDLGLSLNDEDYEVPEIDYDHDSEDDNMDEEEEEDGEYRFGTQEDGMIAMDTKDRGITHQQISKVLEPFARAEFGEQRQPPVFTSFLPESGVMAAYRPTLSSSPLMNPTTAKIFCHFVYVLGPSMSLFERVPANPHIAFTPGAGLHGPQNVWSYTVPMMSLHHPPLLHAILALSSLHISKLNKGPEQASLLHYHIALRRLGKAIASDKHRGHVATLAATLMLAYYETMAAEHDKWSSHIHGAKQLLKEIDFDRVSQRVEQYDVDGEDAQRFAGSSGVGGGESPSSGLSLLAARRMRRQYISEDVDDSLKSYLMGSKAHRAVENKQRRKQSDRMFSKHELDTLKLQADMFWWYTKMDCYQSLLSGCPLILDYVHWGQCPPRARIGTLGTMTGSSDHFFLILGRLCDFQSRDVERKKALAEANGGHWVPPPEMGGPPRNHRRPPHAQQHTPPPDLLSGTSVPEMGGPPIISPTGEPVQFGMIPPQQQAPRMPRGFGPEINSPSREQQFSFEDPDAARLEAEREWLDIFKAFAVYQDSLGPEYQPLDIEYSMPAPSTPFGSPIYYKNYAVASLQLLYNMALIVLHRCHPDMPPVSMMASGIQARKTQPYATNIGRIVAGLVPTNTQTQIHPSLGAALIEAGLPIFFAGVQYDTQEQRDWTVRKLREINRLTGWSTASRILLGCQRAWEMMAGMGKGPEYVRPPFEDEAEMFYEYHEYVNAVRSGSKVLQEEDEMKEAGGDDGRGRFLWKVAGRKVVDAAGILGEMEPWDMSGYSIAR